MPIKSDGGSRREFININYLLYKSQAISRKERSITMDLRYLQTFATVADLGSFTAAARRLGYSQSTISFQIRQIEEELDVRLFDRFGHTIRLTLQGQQVLSYAHELDRISQDLTRALSASDSPRGIVRLATADSLSYSLFKDSFADFQKRCPEISLKIVTGGTDSLFDLLDHNEADLLITLDAHIYQSEYHIASEEEVPVHFVCAPGAPFAPEGTVDLDQLTACPFLLTEKGMSYRRIMDEWLAARSIELCPILESGNTSLLCALAAEGLGIALLPDYVTETDVRDGRLIRLDIAQPEIHVWKQMLYHRDKWLSPAIQAFISYYR